MRGALGREDVAIGLYPKLGWVRRPGAEDRERVQRAMERLSVTDLARRHLGELSGGQRQRVYVAQGVAQRHEALLLDEPLTGLDLVSARVIEWTRTRPPGRTRLASSAKYVG